MATDYTDFTERHKNIVVIHAIEFARVALYTFNHKTELSIKRDRAFVGGEHFEFDSFHAGVSRCANGIRGQSVSKSLSPVFRQDPHTQRADVTKTFPLLSDDIAPANDDPFRCHS